jgi:gliding motility-associated-like protein
LLEIDEPAISGTISGSDSLCYGSPGDTLLLSGQRGDVLDWIVSPDEGQSWESAQAGGVKYVYPDVVARRWYAVTVKNGVCPSDTSDPAKIVAFPRVIASAGPDVTIQRLESIHLQGQANGDVLWQPSTALSDSTVVSPLATPLETIIYRLLVTDQHGCSASDSVKITVIIPIPTAITPNGDGLNDNFEIFEIERFEKNTLRVYDRWGALVYEAAPYRNEWDGKYKDGAPAPDDTYFFVFDRGRGEKPESGYIMVKR